MIKLLEQKIKELYESPGRQSRALFKTYKHETLHILKKTLQPRPIRVIIRLNILHLNNFISCCTYRDIQYRKPNLKKKIMKELIEEQREELIEKTLELMRDALINIRDFEKSTNLMFNFYMNKNKHVQR